MEFLTEKEMKDSSRLFGKVIVPPGSALAYHTHEGEGEAYHILQGKGRIRLFYAFYGVIDYRKVAKPQKVHFQKTEIFNCIFRKLRRYKIFTV